MTAQRDVSTHVPVSLQACGQGEEGYIRAGMDVCEHGLVCMYKSDLA